MAKGYRTSDDWQDELWCDSTAGRFQFRFFKTLEGSDERLSDRDCAFVLGNVLCAG